MLTDICLFVCGQTNKQMCFDMNLNIVTICFKTLTNYNQQRRGKQLCSHQGGPDCEMMNIPAGPIMRLIDFFFILGVDFHGQEVVL